MHIIACLYKSGLEFNTVFCFFTDKFSVLPPSLQKQSSIPESISMPTLSVSALVDSTPTNHKKLSLDTIDGHKDVDATSDYCTLPRAPKSCQKLEHLFAVIKHDDVLLEENRIEEEKKLKEYKEAPKEVCHFDVLYTYTHYTLLHNISMVPGTFVYCIAAVLPAFICVSTHKENATWCRHLFV